MPVQRVEIHKTAGRYACFLIVQVRNISISENLNFGGNFRHLINSVHEVILNCLHCASFTSMHFNSLYEASAWKKAAKEPWYFSLATLEKCGTLWKIARNTIMCGVMKNWLNHWFLRHFHKTVVQQGEFPINVEKCEHGIHFCKLMWAFVFVQTERKHTTLRRIVKSIDLCDLFAIDLQWTH